MTLTAFDASAETDEHEHPYGAPELCRGPGARMFHSYEHAVQVERYYKYLDQVHSYVFCNGADHLSDVIINNPRLFDVTHYAGFHGHPNATRYHDCRADSVAFPNAQAPSYLRPPPATCASNPDGYLYHDP